MWSWMILLELLFAGGPGGADATYLAEYDKWKTRIEHDLRTNWVPLAGLFWLKPGVNTFGTDRENDIVLPEGTAPPRAGSFELSGKQVTLHAADGVAISIESKPVKQAQLTADSSGGATTVELGRLRLHTIVRGERVGIRVKDLDSPALREFQPPVFFPLDLQYRVTAKWAPSDGTKTLDIPNVLGDVTPTPVLGEVRFKIGGKDCSLIALGSSAEKGLFFVFSDATSRTETYPSGRFLSTGPVANGTVVLDFNMAHNPPCAVTAYATCPLAPVRNRLPVAIPAGEKYRRH